MSGFLSTDLSVTGSLRVPDNVRKRICQYYLQHPTDRHLDIAREFGLHRSTVTKIVRRSGVYLNRLPQVLEEEESLMGGGACSGVQDVVMQSTADGSDNSGLSTHEDMQMVLGLQRIDIASETADRSGFGIEVNMDIEDNPIANGATVGQNVDDDKPWDGSQEASGRIQESSPYDSPMIQEAPLRTLLLYPSNDTVPQAMSPEPPADGEPLPLAVTGSQSEDVPMDDAYPIVLDNTMPSPVAGPFQNSNSSPQPPMLRKRKANRRLSAEPPMKRKKDIKESESTPISNNPVVDEVVPVQQNSVTPPMSRSGRGARRHVPSCAETAATYGPKYKPRVRTGRRS
ncbi:hypothetical protein V5O48_005264 [Marasmius crinis-equi]|uniref:RWP-RK domain-containing protein n=1 Tax=Marasmius crinis-equi TaxID=585013 RepID=A0ABR3FMS2_9AGAR